MKDPLPIRVIDAIEAGIKTARQHPKDGPEAVPDDYIAWCVWNELRREGFKVIESADDVKSSD